METLKKKVSAKINYPALAELFEVDMTLFEQSTIKANREDPLSVYFFAYSSYLILSIQFYT